MEYLEIFLMITVISAVVASKTKRKIEELVPFTTMGLVIVVYISGILGNLIAGINTIIGIGIFAFLYLLYLLIKAKEKKVFLKTILTPGLAVYAILFLFFIWLNQGRIFGNYDEFNHWGLIIKDMFNNNNFAFARESATLFNEYPPFTAIFQYIFLKLSGTYAEDTIIIAHSLLYLSIIIPIIKTVNWDKSLKKLLLLIPIIVGMPLIFYENFYLNILVDATLGIFLAYILYQWYSKTDVKLRNLTVAIGMIAIGLTKLSGIGLMVAVVLIVIGDILRKKENRKRDLLSILIITAIAILLIAVWNIRMAQNKANRNWDMNTITIDSVTDLLTNQIENEKSTIMKLYLHALYQKDTFTERNLTVVTATMLLIAFTLFLYKKVSQEQKRKYKYFSISLFVLELAYLIYLIFVYVFLFNVEEAIALSSFERYIGTMLLGIFMFHIMVANEEMQEIDMKSEVILLTILVILLPMNTIQKKYIDKEQYKLVEMTKRKVYIKILSYKDKLSKEDKIAYVDIGNEEARYSLQIAKYQMLPIKVESIVRTNHLIEELKENGYTYLYIQKITEAQKEKWQEILGIELKNRTMYQIVEKEEAIQLVER